MSKQMVREVMSENPVTVPAGATVQDAARLMRDEAIGDVIVLTDRGTLCGVVTDRDVTVRVVAEGRNPTDLAIDEICSHDVHTVAPGSSIGEAVELMTRHAIRRLPVVDGDRPVGIVTLGDLAEELEGDSALAEISAMPPNG